MILVILQQSAILLLALCAARLMRRQSAAMRHFVLAAGLVSSLLVPFLNDVFPEFEFVRATPLPVFAQDPIDILLNLNGHVPTVTRLQPSPWSAPVQVLTEALRWIWFGGIALAAIVLVLGAGRITWLAFRSKPLALKGWIAALQEVSSGMRLSRRIGLLQNDRAVLGTWGVLRPKVFVPHDAGRWPAERIRVVLTHELAHIKRLDWPVQLLSEIARAVYWFNPLFWILCRRLKLESEHACDDVVLRAGFDAKDYASHLLELARTYRDSARAWAPVLAMSRAKHLERRFVAMLNASMNHRSLSRLAVFGICLVTACLTLPLAAMRAPQQTLPAASSSEVVVTESATGASMVAPQKAEGKDIRLPVEAAVLQLARVIPPPVSKPPAPIPMPVAEPTPVQGLADGSLSGTVSDASGAVVPGVRLTVMPAKPMMSVAPPQEWSMQETTTGDVGEYEFRALTPGQYVVTASLPGFSIVSNRVEIRPSQTSRQNITLLVGSVSQRVTVSVTGQARPEPDGVRRRVRVGGNVQAANLISQVRPIYPQSARDAGIAGSVRLQGVIGVDGMLTGLRVVAGDRDLAAAALESVRQWLYRPAMLNGEPVEVATDIQVEFELAR